MTLNLKLSFIVTAIGAILNIFSMVVLAYIFHQFNWGNDSLGLIFLIFLPAGLIPTAIAFIIGGSLSLYRHLKFKKLNFTLMILAIFLLPIAMMGSYVLIDKHSYEVKYTFTVEKWASANDDERARIIPSFRKQYQLVGENIEIVPPLLGIPDTQTETRYYYNLGYDEYLLGRDPIYYLIEFDDMNIINAERIYKGWDLPTINLVNL